MNILFKLGRCFGWFINKLASLVHSFLDGIDDYLLDKRIERKEKLERKYR